VYVLIYFRVVQLARSKKVEELASDPQRHAFREAAAAAAEQRLAQECTFVPDTSKPGVPRSAGVEPKAPFTVAGQKADNIIERCSSYHLLLHLLHLLLEHITTLS
jgi:hypothetical protein